MLGLIPQGGEINGVRYWKHGFGAMLRDAGQPLETAGTVNIDVNFGALDRTVYIFNLGDISVFARSLNWSQPSRLQVEHACFRLVGDGVLQGPTTPSTDPRTRWNGCWSFDPQLGEVVGNDQDDGPATLERLRRALEALGPQRDRKALERDYVPFDD